MHIGPCGVAVRSARRPSMGGVLEELRISGLGAIDDAVLDLHPGLTVVTGETGAGKTMVVHGLALLFGGRLDSGLVRAGAGRAVVEGRVLAGDDVGLLERLAEAGGELDDGVVLLSRSMTAEGRSRAHLGGRSVPVGVLAEIAESQLALHGQGDQLRLLRPAEQRAALDRLAGEEVLAPLREYRAAYERWQDVTAELAEIAGHRRERLQEAELLRLGRDEVRSLAPEPGEDVALAAELSRLGHADALSQAAEDAHGALVGRADDDEAVDATGLVARARQGLAAVAGHDADLDGLARRLGEASYLLADVAADLASYASGIDADPARLAKAQERRAALTRLCRAYGPAVDDVLGWAARAELRLAELDTDDGRLEELATEQSTLLAGLARLAATVSASRTAAAQRLGAAVTAELVDLAMPQAVVTAELRQRDEAGGLAIDGRQLAFGPDGVDDAELLLTPHSGAPARPLGRGASGGELSRVMLAVEVVFAAADPVPTMVFDEVDAGVGGRAAVEVGRRLARLARTHQVIVVTHLPQVAAFADRHLHVTKSGDGLVTASGVTLLDDSGRVAELSRMLAGLEGSELAMGHAEELLAAASSAKAKA